MKARTYVVLIGAIAGTVIAQENLPPGRPPPEEALKRFDKNGDGKISRDEAPDRMARHFDEIDANHDGFITLDELKAHDAKMESGGTTAPAMTNRVSISIEGDFRVIRANGIPNHDSGKFPNRNNPNAIREISAVYRVPVKQKMNDKPMPTGVSWFGIALNGVTFEPGTQEFFNEDRNSGWNYEAIGGTSNLGIDMNNAHVQPNGQYHYHSTPVGLVAKLGGDTNRMLLVGWAADGFPIYTANGFSDPKDAKSAVRKMKSSYRLKEGVRPSGPGFKYDGRFTEDFEFVKGSGDLDECNGRFSVTPEFPEGIYCYFITDEFPRISRFWRGVADPSFNKHGPPPGQRRF